MPIGVRSEIATVNVPGSTRRMAASATHGEFRSFCRHDSRSAATMLRPRRPSRIASTSPFDMRSLPCTVMRDTRSASADNTPLTA
jgi:hypothetical protein